MKATGARQLARETVGGWPKDGLGRVDADPPDGARMPRFFAPRKTEQARVEQVSRRTDTKTDGAGRMRENRLRSPDHLLS